MTIFPLFVHFTCFWNSNVQNKIFYAFTSKVARFGQMHGRGHCQAQKTASTCVLACPSFSQKWRDICWGDWRKSPFCPTEARTLGQGLSVRGSHRTQLDQPTVPSSRDTRHKSLCSWWSSWLFHRLPSTKHPKVYIREKGAGGGSLWQ